MLTNKTVLVTGAGSGIGRATSLVLARAGAKVFAASHNAAKASETADLIRAEGGVAEAMGADVSSETEVQAMIEGVIAAFGRLDGAFNNAGLIMANLSFQDLSGHDWDRVLNVNLKGVFLCMKHEIIAMRRTGGGAIVNNSSTQGMLGTPNAAEYCASKHGVLGATRSAACEASATGVRVNAVLPGMIGTPPVRDFLTNDEFKPYRDIVMGRHTIGRFGTPEDVGYAVKWLLSDEASFVNGAAIAVDGGYTAN